jgi:hypothetical protein
MQQYQQALLQQQQQAAVQNQLNSSSSTAAAAAASTSTKKKKQKKKKKVAEPWEGKAKNFFEDRYSVMTILDSKIDIPGATVNLLDNGSVCAAAANFSVDGKEKPQKLVRREHVMMDLILHGISARRETTGWGSSLAQISQFVRDYGASQRLRKRAVETALERAEAAGAIRRYPSYCYSYAYENVDGMDVDYEIALRKTGLLHTRLTEALDKTVPSSAAAKRREEEKEIKIHFADCFSKKRNDIRWMRWRISGTYFSRMAKKAKRNDRRKADERKKNAANPAVQLLQKRLKEEVARCAADAKAPPIESQCETLLNESVMNVSPTRAPSY